MAEIEELFGDNSNIIFESDEVSIELDLLQSATHTRAASVPEDPVEAGSVTDVVINGQPVVSIQGFVTNYPVKPFAIIRDLATGGQDKKRVQDVFDQLETLYETRTPFNILTRRKEYENMVFESITLPESAEDGVDALLFTATCKQINIQEAVTVSIPEDNVTEEDKGLLQSETDASKQPTSAASASEESSSSLLFGVFN
jgi:hypothetical protein